MATTVPPTQDRRRWSELTHLVVGQMAPTVVVMAAYSAGTSNTRCHESFERIRCPLLDNHRWNLRVDCDLNTNVVGGEAVRGNGSSLIGLGVGLALVGGGWYEVAKGVAAADHKAQQTVCDQFGSHCIEAAAKTSRGPPIARPATKPIYVDTGAVARHRRRVARIAPPQASRSASTVLQRNERNSPDLGRPLVTNPVPMTWCRDD